MLADFGMQHFAPAQIGEIGAALLAEAHHQGLLFLDEFDAEPRAAPVTPMRAGERRQDLLGRDLAEVAKTVEQYLLFHVDLRIGAQMLQTTAAAQPEVLTLRRFF